MKKLVIFLLLLCGTVQAQNQFEQDVTYSPGGIMDTVFDHYGNKFTLKDIFIDTDPNSVNKVASFNDCNSGYFKLYYETGSGFELQNDATHIQRRAVLCQLFNDLSQFIVPVNPNTPVNIFVRSFVNNLFTPPSYVAAYASPVFLAPPIITSVGGGIVDNAIWQTINSGVDPFTAFAPPISNLNAASAGFYHGIIAFNISNPTIWHQNMSPCPTTQKDLYSTGLHEITHALGFASLINGSGQSKFGAAYPYFSRYDKFLQTTLGANLLTNTGACSSMYGFGFNPNLNTSILINNGTICTTPNLIKFGGSVHQNVYTFPAIIPPNPNPQFEDGSALSHFEDQCHTPNNYPDNSYYVMSNGSFVPNTNPSQFYTKRFLKDEERKVLCDIGYKVTNVFGSHTYSNATLCGGNQIVGINDGITYNSTGNTYSYIIGNNSNITINNFLQNDYNPNSSATLTFECPQSVLNKGSVTIINGTTLKYTSFGNTNGVDLIRYVPILQNGQKGNITYIFIYIANSTCSISTACNNFISNGNFETSSGCWNQSNGSSSSCWTDYSGTTDLFTLFGDCTDHPNYNLPTALSSPPSTTWNNSSNNKFFIGIYGAKANSNFIESKQNKLTAPLIANQTYTVSFKAKISNTNNQNNATKLVLTGSSANQIATTSNITSTPAGLTSLKVIDIPNNNTWNAFNETFTVPSNSSPINFVQFINGMYLSTSNVNPIISYIYIDDIAIVDNNVQLSFSPPTFLCINDGAIDLNNFVNNPNGVFTGNGVSNGHFFNPSLAGIGIHIITYTVDACNSISVNIEVKPATDLPIFNPIQPIFCGDQINPLPTTSINGITGTWSPALNNTATTTYTFTPSSGFCATTTTMIIEVISNCCVTPIATFDNQINASQLLVFTVGQIVAINNDIIVNSNCSLTGLTLRFGPNVRILVNTGNTLTLTNCTLYSCSEMWKGIEVMNNASLKLNNTRIEDAIDGVLSLSYASLQINNCFFNKNKTGVHIEGHFVGLNCISGSTFDCSVGNLTPNNYLKAPYQNQKSHFGVYLSGNSNVQIGFGNNWNIFKNLEIGIYSSMNGKCTVNSSTFENINTLCPVSGACNVATEKGWCIYSKYDRELSVGNQSSSSLSNEFKNSYNGIYIEQCNKFSIYNNTFTNITTPQPFTQPFLAADAYCIYALNGQNNANDHTVENNTFTTFENGLFYKSNAANALTVKNNNWSKFNVNKATAIHLLDNPTQSIYISNNIFNSSSTFSGFTAIKVENVNTAQGHNLSISRNAIRNVQNGIWVTNYYKPAIFDHKSNLISMGSTAAGIYFPATLNNFLGIAIVGIQVANCPNAKIYNNSIERTSYSSTNPSPLASTDYINQYGIVVGNNCTGTNVVDNLVKLLGTGIYAFGNTPVTLKCNNMVNNATGLWVNSLIGNQGTVSAPQDNTWTIPSGYMGVRRNGQTQPQFFTRSFSLPYMPNTSSSQMIPPIAINPQPSSISAPNTCFIGAGNPPAGLVQVINEQGEYSYLSEEELKSLDVDLYKTLKINPDFYDETTEEGLKIKEFVDSVGMSNSAKIYEYEEKLEQKDTIGAKELMALFDAYSDVEYNYKRVYEIYNRSWLEKQIEFTAEDSLVLNEIANLSPRVAGNAVYTARVLLGLMIIDTETYAAKSAQTNSAISYSKLKIYPNPSSEFFHYELPLKEGETGVISIMDVSGKELQTWSVDFNGHLGSFNVQNFAKGVYMFELTINNDQKLVQKLLVK